MAYAYQSNGEIPALLFSYYAANKTNNLKTITDPTGLLDAITDPTNEAATNQSIIDLGSGSGHKKAVRIWSKQRQIAADVATTKTCLTGGVEKPLFEEVVPVAQYRSIALEISEATIRKMTEEYSKIVAVKGVTSQGQLEVMAELWNEAAIDMNALRRSINLALLTSLATEFGAYKGGVIGALKSFPIYRGVDAAAGSIGSPVLHGFNQMMQEFRKSTFNGKPYICAQGIFELANTSLEYGCCNNGGTDFGKMNNSARHNFYIEEDVTTATGSNDGIIAFMPGALQMIRYNEYVGDFSRPIDNIQRGTIVDPLRPNLKYDVRLKPDGCDEKYTLEFGLNFDLYAAPTTMFKAGDTTVGINGVFKGLATSI